MNTVHEEAAVGRRLGPEGIPSSPVGGDGREDEHVGEGEGAGAGVGAEGPDEAPKRMDPWNKRKHSSRSEGGSVARNSYCPRRMGGNFADSQVKGYLNGGGSRKGREMGGAGKQ